jgi:hypothetical protein
MIYFVNSLMIKCGRNDGINMYLLIDVIMKSFFIETSNILNTICTINASKKTINNNF